MAMTNNKQSNVTTNSSSKAPRDRYTIGTTETYYEVAGYLTGMPKLDSAKVTSLFNNPKMHLAETEGKSLKVMFRTPQNELKFCGFVTAGDASQELSKEHIDPIMEAAKTEAIVKAVSADELIDMF